jgi:hypothetical protein
MSKLCKNVNVNNINSINSDCNVIKIKKNCEKNKNNLIKEKNKKNDTMYKKFVHTFYKNDSKSQDNNNLEEKKISNKINKLNNKIDPKYKLTYINTNNISPINMHVIDFLTDPSLYKFMSELGDYMEVIDKKILCSKNNNYNKNLCEQYKKNKVQNCDIICHKNKYFLKLILDKVLTVDFYQLILLILKRLNESFNNKHSYNFSGKKYSLFKISNDDNKIEVDFYGLYFFIYNDLQPFLANEKCSYIVKLIINIISYYIDDMYRHYNSITTISKKKIKNIKSYTEFVQYLPNCGSLDNLKYEINDYINKIISTKNKGNLIDISKIDFWYDIPKIVIKILGKSIVSSIFSSKIKC